MGAWDGTEGGARMASVIGNPIFIAPGNELIVTVWFEGVDPNGLHVVGPTMPAVRARFLYGHTGIERWYDLDARGAGSTNYRFNVRNTGSDWTFFRVVVGGVT
jgi:hypothetical protein